MADNSIEKFMEKLELELANKESGEFQIPRLKMSDGYNDKLQEVDLLIFILRQLHPEFTFWKSETLFDNEGLKINWKNTEGMSETEAIHSIRKTKHEELMIIEREQELKELEDGREATVENADERDHEEDSGREHND